MRTLPRNPRIMRPSTGRNYGAARGSRLARLQVGPGLAAGGRQLAGALCQVVESCIGEIDIALTQRGAASHPPAAADASRPSGLYVGCTVADQNGSRQVDTQSGGGTGNHAGSRFAAIAVAAIALDFAVG